MIKLFEQPHIKLIGDELYGILRTGWVKRGVTNAENVGEHTAKMIQLARQWASDLDVVDIIDLENIIAFHDWPEIIVGDTLTYHLNGESYKHAKKAKLEHEITAMKELCNRVGLDGKSIYDYWNRYNHKEDLNAKLATQIDKIQMILQALDYERSGEPISAIDFTNELRVRNQIQHPFLLKILEQVESEVKK
jgi:putative hydrolase of HD superfamily